MGYLRYDQEKEMNADDNYVWLYVSPEYPMAQVSCRVAIFFPFWYIIYFPDSKYFLFWCLDTQLLEREKLISSATTIE